MIHVKICGVTTEEDALFAAGLGAWALGLNFAEGSPRRLTLGRASDIADTIPRRVRKVGVFVNASRREVERAIEECSLDAVQFHGEETSEMCEGWPCEVIKAFPLRSEGDLAALAGFRSMYHLVDSRGNGARGGTGKTVDWTLAARAAASCERLLLAGGLKPGNVGEAVRRVRPFGVDVASGVESSPGIKDPYKMEAFFRAVKTAAEEVAG
jgi:phosphoribosylanthranilate isomerase